MPSAAQPALVNPIHLVLGDSAAGCVRAACACFDMPGTVIGFSDDLAHGPLDDSEARAAYMRTFTMDDGENVTQSCAPLMQWPALIRHLDLERPDAVIIWSGDNVADTSFVAMACDRLAGRPELLMRVRVPEIDMRPFVAMHSPVQLAQLYRTRRQLSDAERLLLAQDFTRIRDTCGLVRRLEQGRVVAGRIDDYDALLLNACGPGWQAAMRVVATAMRHCDGPNLMSDAFFCARLGFLIDAGRIETSGSRTALRNCLVRHHGNDRDSKPVYRFALD